MAAENYEGEEAREPQGFVEDSDGIVITEEQAKREAQFGKPDWREQK